MWDFEHSVEARASRERVWAVWTDISGWPSWNPGVARAELDGPLAEGATGNIRAAGGPTSTLKVLEVEPDRSFVTEASERFMRLRFEHELADAVAERLAGYGARPWQVELTSDLLVGAILKAPAEVEAAAETVAASDPATDPAADDD